uniref:Uncharacterized protein n=1 Tax=Arundo donax TaxID=35708 RepID=A0A0A9BWV7_ARUDO
MQSCWFKNHRKIVFILRYQLTNISEYSIPFNPLLVLM